MLTSLLTFYIASSLQEDLPQGAIKPKNTSSVVRTASVNFSNLISTNPIPIKKAKYIAPIINARGVIAMDGATGSVLFEKSIHDRMQIASITKLMTVLLILEENKLEDIVTISKNATGTEGSSMRLQPGEQITVENLLYGAMVQSANDAAVALAEYNAGTTAAFVEKMNKRALELDLVNTHFTNPIGLDHPDNYSSPYDIAKLGLYVYHSPFIKKAATIKTLEVKSITGEINHKLENTNELLDSYLHVKGLKTGSTQAAGLCLVSIAENDAGTEIITVVLDSPARFTETKVLIDWIFRAFNWS